MADEHQIFMIFARVSDANINWNVERKGMCSSNIFKSSLIQTEIGRNRSVCGNTNATVLTFEDILSICVEAKVTFVKGLMKSVLEKPWSCRRRNRRLRIVLKSSLSMELLCKLSCNVAIDGLWWVA